MPFGIFKESEHPCGKGGQFAKKGGGSSAKVPSIGGVKKATLK